MGKFSFNCSKTASTIIHGLNVDFRKSISAFPYERAYFVFGGGVEGGDAASLTERSVFVWETFKTKQKTWKPFNKDFLFLSLSDKVTTVQSVYPAAERLRLTTILKSVKVFFHIYLLSHQAQQANTPKCTSLKDSYVYI